MEYKVNTVVEFKKNHPCDVNAKQWKILKIDESVKLECTNCGHIIQMKRFDFDNKVIKVIKEG